MNHEEAGRTLAVERYLQGEMAEQEREEFEAHYFSCVECGEGVQAGFLLKENAKIVLREPWEEARPWWRLPVPTYATAFATVALTAFVVFQNTVVLPALRAPQAISAAVILDGVTRSSLKEIRRGEALRFQMAVEAAPAAGTLRVDLENESKRAIRSGVVPAPGPNRALDVFFPGTLDPGRYTLVVRSVPAGAELARDSFRMVEENGTK